MVKQIIRVGILILALSLGQLSYCQIKKEKQADKSFDRTAYIDAIQIYEGMVEKGYVNGSILQNLADANYFNGKLLEANKWYTELFEGQYEDKNLGQLPSEYYYRYSQTLKAVKNYEKADELMEQFSRIEKEDQRVTEYNKDRAYLSRIEKYVNQYEAELLQINSAFSDYGGTIIGNDFVFTSARATDHQHKLKIHSWTNEGYTSLYRAKIDGSGMSNPERFPLDEAPYVNDATAVFNQDGTIMFFTRNNAKSNGKSKQNKDHNSSLKIYRALKQTDGSWGRVLELPFNSDNFNTAHPALTPDDKWLYFASDRDGAIGQSDLYRVAVFKNDGYGPVENLGPSINTEGRENFPFISSDNQLYFASDGYPGLGGMDVFVTQLNGDGTFGPIVNMGEPINSSMDDFGFYLKDGTGFVSSNRAGGMGSDDIYKLTERSCVKKVEGKVYDIETKEVLANAKIVVSDGLYEKSTTLQSNDKGQFTISDLGCGIKYRIRPEKEAYNTVELVFSFERDSEVKTFDIGLERAVKPLQVNDDLFKRLQLKPIYFDFDKTIIRKDAAIELMKIVEVMQQYPTMKIDVRSHTDSRGNDTYNLNLSDRRVKATIEWMTKQGIEASRLTGRGYGETQLLNGCSNGEHCTDAEHQVNRRSEFIIKEI
ncbi:OmpA family protein [Myroides odoratimimus]|uniref:OmpA family protein n=1 Tax=Myroides odoratimimus TaxID=76832 RepID=UPI002576B274|nr:OmpA family protein [Myroides odoratimimus]MDM1327923.1 OmpA family protein [Myroides odoratimimus]